MHKKGNVSGCISVSVFLRFMRYQVYDPLRKIWKMMFGGKVASSITRSVECKRTCIVFLQVL